MNANSLPRETGRHSPSPPAGPEMLKMGVEEGGDDRRPSRPPRSDSLRTKWVGCQAGKVGGRVRTATRVYYMGAEEMVKAI